MLKPLHKIALRKTRYINFMLSDDIAVANAEYIAYASPLDNVISNEDYIECMLDWNDEAIDILYNRKAEVKTMYYENLDKETLTLFGYIEIESEEKWAKSADTEICRKWWDYMADIMETNPDNSPVSNELKNVFHLD